MAKQEGLGRGLSSLIPSLTQSEETRLNEIPIKEISANPNQPRKRFEREAFKELVASIKEFGLVQPVVVRPKRDGYELVAGERRWKAAREAGFSMIPAVIKSSTDVESLEITLVENLQRENLNAVEEAAAYQQLIDDFEVTQAELAQRLGKNRATIANTLRLLRLPERVKQLIIEGNLSSGHARALLPLEDKRQIKLANRVIKEDLSVRQTEELVSRMRVEKLPKRRVKTFKPESFDLAAKELSTVLRAKVKVGGSSTGGKIEIAFESLDELERLRRLLGQVAKKKKA